jgi:hypothetical protein
MTEVELKDEILADTYEQFQGSFHMMPFVQGPEPLVNDDIYHDTANFD